jgi:hypothetical protein
MDYQKTYEKLINNAKIQSRKKSKKYYYEKHHIIPKCLNGTNEKENLVLLTAKEHFIAHKLLTKIYKGNKKINHAFHLMSFMNKRKYEISAKDYDYVIKIIKHTPISDETRTKLKNIKHTKEWNEKISKTLKNHIVTKETREKISISNKGKICTEESRKNYINGNTNKNLGRIQSIQTKIKISNGKKGIKKTEEVKNKISIGSINSRIKCIYCNKVIPLNIYNRCHGNNCKNNKINGL